MTNIGLTNEQIAFFKENGYLILKGILDKDLCAKARDRLWASLPEGSQLKRDDPATHVGPFEGEDVQADPIHVRQGFLWQLREIGTEQMFVDLVYSPALCEVAEQLLGEGMLQPPKVGGEPMGSRGAAWPGGPTDPAISDGIRGIYCTLPYGDKERQADYCHTDGHPFNLGIVGLIDDVPADGGSFKVWPKSHRRLYPTFQMQYDQPRIPYYDHLPSYKGLIQSEAYMKEIKAVMEDTEPVDCCGEEGDVILWHHRLAHMAGHNYSDVIRQAVLYDFTRTDLDTCRMDPPQADMWRDWSAGLRESTGSYSDGFAKSQRPDK